MGEPRVVTVRAEPLTAAGWAPFGALPVDDTEPADPVHVEFTWGDPHVNYISHSYDEVEHTNDGVWCARMYRHTSHTQVLMPLDVDSVVAVAPAGVEFTDSAHFDTIRAFRLRPLDCFVLARGTWHWGPFPVAPGTVRMLNLQGRRYIEDNAHVDFDGATQVEVVL